jgi:hypothetical protein
MTREFFRRLKAEPDQQKRIAMLDVMLVAEGVMTQAEVDEVNNAPTDDEKHAIHTRQFEEQGVRFRAWMHSFVKMTREAEWHALSRASRLEAARIHYEQYHCTHCSIWTR